MKGLTETYEKSIIDTHELDKLLKENRIFINPLSIYQLQDWIDWLIMHTRREVKKEDFIEAIENFENNWNW